MLSFLNGVPTVSIFHLIFYSMRDNITHGVESTKLHSTPCCNKGMECSLIGFSDDKNAHSVVDSQ